MAKKIILGHELDLDMMLTDTTETNFVPIEGNGRRVKRPEADDANLGTAPLIISGVPRTKKHFDVDAISGGHTYKPLWYKVDLDATANTVFTSIGGRLTVTPKTLFATDSYTEVCDEYNPMGKGGDTLIQQCQMIDDFADDNTYEIYSPKIIPLKHQKPILDSNKKPVAFMVCVANSASDYFVNGWIMYEYDAGINSLSSVKSYEWEVTTIDTQEQLTGIKNGFTSTNIPAVDAVELDDGTLLLVVSWDDKLEIYRNTTKLQDAVSSWELVNDSLSWGASDDRMVAIETVGNRIVIANAEATSATVDILYSDDYGLTWDTSGSVTSGVNNKSVDLYEGADGDLRLCIAETTQYRIWSSPNGVDWSVEHTDTAFDHLGVTLFQEPTGRWVNYYINNEAVGSDAIRTDYSADETAVMAGYAANAVLMNLTDTDMQPVAIHARPICENMFVDIAVVYQDTGPPGDDIWRLAIFRTHMWSGFAHDMQPSPNYLPISYWDQAWFPIAYPSTSDGHPNLNNWTRAGTGGTVTLNNDHLDITTSGTSRYYHNNLTAARYDDGIVVFADMQLVSGETSIQIFYDDGGTNEVEASIKFSLTSVTLYDDSASTARDTVTPTNWDPRSRNIYIICCIGGRVQVFRAPRTNYAEFQHFEKILESASMANAGAGLTDRVRWGNIDYNLGTLTGHSHWYGFAYMDHGTDIIHSGGWDFTLEAATGNGLTGGKAHVTKQGLFQGMYINVDGSRVMEGDTWEVNTEEIDGAQNILEVSPSKKWRWDQPTNWNGPSNLTFDIKRTDDLAFNAIDAFAVFGKNFMDFDLKLSNSDGSSTVTVFNSASLGGSDIGYIGTYKYTSKTDNFLEACTTAGAPAISITTWIPGQFAPVGEKKWFVKNTSTGASVQILDNTDRDLILASDTFTATSFFIYGSHMAFELDQSYEGYERLMLVITEDLADLPNNMDSWELGTLVLGRTIDINDNDWKHQFGRVANNQVTKSFNGKKWIKQLGAPMRTLDLQYSGLVDNGNAIVEPISMYELLKQGEKPLVWIDDDTTGTAGSIAWSEPILLRIVDPPSASHEIYLPTDESTAFPSVGTVNRNVISVSLRLEEIL